MVSQNPESKQRDSVSAIAEPLDPRIATIVLSARVVPGGGTPDVFQSEKAVSMRQQP